MIVMAAPRKGDIRNLEKAIRKEWSGISAHLLAALLIWLFSVFVFMPLAGSVSHAARTLISIIVYVVLIGLLLKPIWGVKRVIDAAVVFPARRFYQKGKTEPEATYFLFRHACYLAIALLVYLLSLPFLLSFHASIAGLALIGLVLWLIYVILKAFPIIIGIVLGRIIEG